jgi:hypothetical protein
MEEDVELELKEYHTDINQLPSTGGEVLITVVIGRKESVSTG